MAELLNRLSEQLARLDPALYITLQDEGSLDVFLAGFQSLEALAESLELSRYDFLEQVLEDEFGEAYLRFAGAGILNYELLNLAEACGQTFQELGWPENADDRLLRYAIIADIDDYLNE